MDVTLALEPGLSTTLMTVIVVVDRPAAVKCEETLELHVVMRSACMALPLSVVNSAEIGVTGESIEDNAASWAITFQGPKRVRMKRS